jgi:anthranilate phosphoribosyltransferase
MALAAAEPSRNLRAIWLGGFWTNVLNPKVAIFFLAFVPQFIAPDTDNKALAFVLLGLLFNLNAIPVNSGWALAAAWMARRVPSSAACTGWTASPVSCSSASGSSWLRPTIPPQLKAMPITPQEALQRTIEHREIFHDEMLHLMRLIMSGEMSPVMMAALITGLRVKKETIGEITAAAQVMREFSTKVHVADTTHLVDIVGTGGDGSHTFNISTCSMFVAAAAGAKVSKHGGRSVSSKSGSADVLEALGVNINLKPEPLPSALPRTGIGFMFAPNHHPAMKNVAPVRKELGVRTIFNILGPLTNPAGAPNILMGVFHPDLVGIQVRALQRLGAEHAVVVYGRDGMDEVSLGAATLVGELKNGEIREYEIHPEDFGLPMASNRALKVETPEQSAPCCWRAGQRARRGARHRDPERRCGAVRRQRGGQHAGGHCSKARVAIESGAAKVRLATSSWRRPRHWRADTMSDILNKIVAVKREEIAASLKKRSLAAPPCGPTPRAACSRVTSPARCAPRSRRARRP